MRRLLACSALALLAATPLQATVAPGTTPGSAVGLFGGYDDHNAFARILKGTLPATKVYEDSQVLAFMNIHPVSPGDLLVSEGTLRNDGTTAAYVHPGYPAVPDLPITIELERQAARIADREGVASINGLNASDDAFYAEGPEWIERLRREGILNIEMESSALFVVARLRGVRAGMICACSSNLVDGASLYSGTKDALQAGWAASIEAALETAVALEL